MSTLFLVSTPIGNLSDLSPRAAEVLTSVFRILAEDTRRTRILADHVGTRVPLVSLHQHNEAARTEKVLGWLQAGEDLALVSDAGTPLVSDPGARLVETVARAGHAVVPIPGASAVLAALVASGLPTERFVFLGFPDRKGEARSRLLQRVARSEETVVLFESPQRLGALLSDLCDACGADRRVAVARELTKLHEELVRATLGEAAQYFADHPAKGEITVVVQPAPPRTEDEDRDREAARALARSLLQGGLKASATAREVARYLGVARNRAYEIVQELTDEEA